MRVVILGYGRMGKEVEKVLEDRGHRIVGIIDEYNTDQFASLSKDDVDVVIEFTRSDIAFENITTCIEKRIPVISGTTGWNEKIDDAINLCNRCEGTFLFASNFSIGVNVMFALNTRLAQLMNNQEQYTPAIAETHHIHKKDKPSGTAVSLAQQIMDNIKRYTGYAEEPRHSVEFAVKSERKGEIFGKHEVKYESEMDSITITHNANSRKGFALGAVVSAEFIHNKVGVFTMNDVLGF